VRVTVPRGAGLAAVTESLQTHGILDAPRWFRLYASLTGNDRSIQAGVYELTPGMSARQILRTLTAGRTALDRLVVPEGLMLSEVAMLAGQQLGIDPDSFLAASRDPSLRQQVGTTGATVEGYLYPSTYYVRVGASAPEVIEQMLEEFEAQWQPAWNGRLEELGYTRDEIVTMASIIEGEVRHPVDRRYVSSVYHNRLERGIRLQADPTVIYAIGRRRRLFERDYQRPSPYNTYLIDGLPPGPIGQPSAGSIDAALYPASTDFLYFVAGPDGKHVFSRTFREHLAAIRRVRSRSVVTNGGGKR
jgi:UPF0755 protein